MSRRDRADLSPADGVLGVMLAVVLAIVATLLLVHWAQCSQEAALCMAGVIRTRRLRWVWLDRLIAWARWHGLRKEIEWEESALENMQHAAEQLPLEIRATRARLERLRVAQVVAANAARGDA